MRSLIVLLLVFLTGCGPTFETAEPFGDDESLGGSGSVDGAETGGASTGGAQGSSGGADASGGTLGATGGVSSGGTGGQACESVWLPDCRGIVYTTDEELYADPTCQTPGVREVYDVRYHYEPDTLLVGDPLCRTVGAPAELVNVWTVAGRDVPAYRWVWLDGAGTCQFIPSPQPIGGSSRVHVRLEPAVLVDYRLEGCL